MSTTKKAKADAKRKRKVVQKNLSRSMTVKIAAMEYIWLWDYRHGMSMQEIASRSRRSVHRVRLGVERARAQENPHVQDGEEGAGGTIPLIWLVPMFPMGSYTPLSPCTHRWSLEAGSRFCCMVCHCSGMDDHPSLERDPNTDPAPERKPEPPTPRKKRRLVRKERRAIQFADKGKELAGCC